MVTWLNVPSERWDCVALGLESEGYLTVSIENCWSLYGNAILSVHRRVERRMMTRILSWWQLLYWEGYWKSSVIESRRGAKRKLGEDTWVVWYITWINGVGVNSEYATDIALVIQQCRSSCWSRIEWWRGEAVSVNYCRIKCTPLTEEFIKYGKAGVRCW